MTVTDYLHSKASKNRIPLNGTFELSPVCNFACKMCYVRKTPAQICAEGKRLKDWQEWLALAKQCHKAGTLYLLLTGGEPFLYPNFRQLYTQLHKMGFILSINSNGTMIDEDTVAWLKEYAPSRVNITLYGASPETYQRICGNGDGFRRAMEAVRLLTEAGIPVVLNCSVIPENQGDMEAIMALGRELNLNTRVATYMFPPARREREESDSRFTPEEAAEMFLRRAKFQLPEAEYKKLLSRPDAQPDTGDDWGSDRGEAMRCRAGRSGFWISWEGIMTACGITSFPREEYPFRDEFAACWNRLTDAVRSARVLAGCVGCPHKGICNPCVATIETETGDVNQKAPYMCRMTACIVEKLNAQREENTHG